MSIKIMTTVWEQSRQKGGTLLTLLALADVANEYGFCWPGFDYLGKRARVSPRQAETAVNRLVEAGEIYCSRGGGRRKSNEYIVCVGLTEAEIAKRIDAFFDVGTDEAIRLAHEVITRRNMAEISMKSTEDKHGKEREKLGVEKMLKTSNDPSYDPPSDTSLDPSGGRGADAPAPGAPASRSHKQGGADKRTRSRSSKAPKETFPDEPAWVDAYCKAWRMDAKAIKAQSSFFWRSLHDLIGDFREAGYTPAVFDKHARWWRSCDWRGQKGERPTWALIRETVADSEAWNENAIPFMARPNGANGKIEPKGYPGLRDYARQVGLAAEETA